jgi:hypothetical protein
MTQREVVALSLPHDAVTEGTAGILWDERVHKKPVSEMHWYKDGTPAFRRSNVTLDCGAGNFLGKKS